VIRSVLAMPLDRPYVVSVTGAMERAGEVAWLDWRPVLVAKNEPVVLPGLASSSRSAACASWRMSSMAAANESRGRSRRGTLGAAKACRLW